MLDFKICTIVWFNSQVVHDSNLYSIRMLEYAKLVLLILFSLSIASCGGGGSSAQSINQAPQVQAGPDQQVLAGARVTLSGSASDSDGTITSYSWAQDSGDPVALKGAD